MEGRNWSSPRWVYELELQLRGIYFEFTDEWLEQFDTQVQQEFFRYVQGHFGVSADAKSPYMLILKKEDVIFLGRALWRADPLSTAAVQFTKPARKEEGVVVHA